jgi:hypothetical protein
LQTNVVEQIKAHCKVNKFLPPKNRTIYEIMREKYGKAGQATDDNTMRRMRLVFWITKATDTYSEYVIIISFPLQQWLRERSILGSKHSVPLVSLQNTQFPPVAFPDTCI